MLPQVVFGYFAVAIVGMSLLVVTRRNPVHSVLWMLLLFFHIAALYLFLNAEFLAAIQIIIYAGAILVLYLFVIMLLNLKEEERARRFVNLWPLGFLVALALLLVLGISAKALIKGPSGIYTIDAVKKTGHINLIGQVLYTEYLFPFEVASVVLLVAIIGAVVLAKKKLRP
ncbi:MAG: NADH-quinone oxidoreductase subunit J [Nitrospirae bacterium]|nr:NADH-quinone oxidoreductase subunit J [Nitrospirota bacterium]